MFFNPRMLFLRNPTPQSFWESPRTDGKEAPVFDSVTVGETSAKLREPHKGNEFPEEKKKLKALWRKGCCEIRFWEEEEESAAVAPAVETTAATAATFAAENGREVGREERWGRPGGWENEKGKRNDTMFSLLRSQIYNTLLSEVHPPPRQFKEVIIQRNDSIFTDSCKEKYTRLQNLFDLFALFFFYIKKWSMYIIWIRLFAIYILITYLMLIFLKEFRLK